MMLFFREAQRRDRRERAARIVDTNAATNAKDGGSKLLRQLQED